MKCTTVADLRNNFRRVSAWITNGNEVEITRRGRPFALLSPLEKAKPHRAARFDFAAQRRAIWSQRVFSKSSVAAMREAERQGEEG